MKIAFFSKHLPSDEPNGVSVQVDRLARTLAAAGHDVTCFSFSPRPEGAPYGLVRLSWGGPARLGRKFAPALRFRTVDTSAFDILHYHGDDYLCAGSPRRVRTFYGSALFEALHAGATGRFFYQALFYLLEWASCLRAGTFTGISRLTAAALPKVSRVIPCGVPLDRFSPDPGAKTPYPSILFVGDFRSRKRGGLLLDAFRERVLTRFPDCQLTVAGPEIRSAPGVRCLGRITEDALIAEYRKAWIYCLPSSYEGFGVPAVEAMACGAAVVAARNRGIAEIVTHGKNGLLCDAPELGNALASLLSDAAERNRIAAEGLECAKPYDMRLVAEKYEAIYRELLRRDAR